MPEPGTLLAASDGVYATRIVRQLAATHGLPLDQVEGTGAGGRVTLKDLARLGGGLPAIAEPARVVTSDDVHASPAARRLAADRGVELRDMVGSAPGGRIRLADVRAAQQATVDEAAPESTKWPSPRLEPRADALRGSTVRLSEGRAALAQGALTSLRQSAQLTTVVEVDVTNLCRADRHATSEEGALGQSHVLPYVAEAVVATLADHPVLNARLDLDAGLVHYHDAVNLGIVEAGPSSVPPLVLTDAETLSAEGIAAALGLQSVGHGTNGAGPTFTLSYELGEILFGTPLLPLDQAATLSLGAVRKRPMVVPDSASTDVIAVRHCAYVSLTYDHRLVDGADAARFLSAVRVRVERSPTVT